MGNTKESFDKLA